MLVKRWWSGHFALADWRMGWRVRDTVAPVMKPLLAHLELRGIRFLLIGGRGLEAHGYVRNTRDVDLLISLAERDEIGKGLCDFGYVLRVETSIFSRWRCPDPEVEDIDLLYVDPGTFAKLDADAVEMDLGNLVVRVPSVAGMVSLKLHAMRNNPERRPRDSSDIQAILLLHPQALGLEELRGLCERYGPPSIYDELKRGLP